MNRAPLVLTIVFGCFACVGLAAQAGRSSATPKIEFHTSDRCLACHNGLTTAEKRAILASWASDASAIASCPSLRSPAGLKKPVSIDEILEALCELDGGPRNPPGGKPCRLRSTERALAA